MIKVPLDFSKFEKALQSLKAALAPPPANDRERDGAIQRFEYTFELAWKTSGKVLDLHGVSIQSPRGIIRELAFQGWIDNPETWFHFLESRNKTSHTYREDVANEVFSDIPGFAVEAEKLLRTLKSKANE
jgi:nucleotidyltransferase substrate binding protein (TIGR01987 family)